MSDPYIHPSQAPLFLKWVKERGGVFLWYSADLGNAGASVYTPVHSEDGSEKTCPGWQYHRAPSKRITRAEDLFVRFEREVERWRVGLKRSYGLRITLSDASNRKMGRLLEKHGDDAEYHFDYEKQQAVITIPERIITLAEWEKETCPTSPAQNVENNGMFTDSGMET